MLVGGMFADGSWQRGGWRIGRRSSDSNGNGGGPMADGDDNDDDNDDDDNDDGAGWRVAGGWPVAATMGVGSGGEV
jgi:hypothetical protein